MPDGDGGTAAVFIKTEFGAINNVMVRNNLMTGDPSYTMYVEDSGSGNDHQRCWSRTTISNAACMATSLCRATTRSSATMSNGKRA